MELGVEALSRSVVEGLVGWPQHMWSFKVIKQVYTIEKLKSHEKCGKLRKYVKKLKINILTVFADFLLENLFFSSACVKHNSSPAANRSFQYSLVSS